eukprot:6204562-Pleurochrysis_carterae.AAC.2
MQRVRYRVVALHCCSLFLRSVEAHRVCTRPLRIGRVLQQRRDAHSAQGGRPAHACVRAGGPARQRARVACVAHGHQSILRLTYFAQRPLVVSVDPVFSRSRSRAAGWLLSALVALGV